MASEVSDGIDPVNMSPEELDEYLRARNLTLFILDGQVCMISREYLQIMHEANEIKAVLNPEVKKKLIESFENDK